MLFSNCAPRTSAPSKDLQNATADTQHAVASVAAQASAWPGRRATVNSHDVHAVPCSPVLQCDKHAHVQHGCSTGPRACRMAAIPPTPVHTPHYSHAKEVCVLKSVLTMIAPCACAQANWLPTTTPCPQEHPNAPHPHHHTPDASPSSKASSHSRAVEVCVSEVCVDHNCSLCLCACKLAAHHLCVTEVSPLQQHTTEHLA